MGPTGTRRGPCSINSRTGFQHLPPGEFGGCATPSTEGRAPQISPQTGACSGRRQRVRVGGGRLGNAGGHIGSRCGCSGDQVGGVLKLSDGRDSRRGRDGRREGGKMS